MLSFVLRCGSDFYDTLLPMNSGEGKSMIIPWSAEAEKNLTKTESSIIRYINAHEENIPNLSIVDIAFETYSSPATVSRAIRKCGIHGFQELRYKLTQPRKEKELVSLNEIMNKSLMEAERLLEQISLPEVLHIVQLIQEARERRIFVFSRGLTSYVGREFSLKLQLLGYNVMETDDPNIMRTVTKHSTEKSLCVFFSLKGETVELVDSARNASASESDIIVCCCNDKSPLLSYATCALIGFMHHHISIKEYEVTSRVPLSIMSRILIDYLVEQGKA